jgi:hypothetical protein
MRNIISDEDVFSQIKDKSKKAYVKFWMDFKMFSVNFNSEEGLPGEDIIIDSICEEERLHVNVDLLLLPQHCAEEEVQLPAAVLAQGENATAGLRN